MLRFFMNSKLTDNLRTAGLVLLALLIMVGAGMVRESIADSFKGTWIHRVCSLISGR